MWIVAMARSASKHAARRSQRTTKRRYFFWHQANVRSAWNRGTTFLIGLPRFFLVFQTRLGIWARIPTLPELLTQRFAHHSLYPLARPAGVCGDDPRLPVRTLHGIKHRQPLAPARPHWRVWSGSPTASRPVREAVDAESLCPSPRGRRPRRHPCQGEKAPSTAPYAQRIIPCSSATPESGLAWRPTCHRPASAATSDAWHSLRPIAARGGHRTSDSR